MKVVEWLGTSHRDLRHRSAPINTTASVLLDPLRKSFGAPTFIAGCLIVLVAGGVIHFWILHHPVNVLGVAAIGALFGISVAITDTQLAADRRHLLVRNPVFLYRIPWELIEAFDARAADEGGA